jgi:hypothetical protein
LRAPQLDGQLIDFIEAGFEVNADPSRLAASFDFFLLAAAQMTRWVAWCEASRR